MPSACHCVFRRNFMIPKTIGLIPPLGYSNETTSHKAIIWLRYISITEKKIIQHARNGHEKSFFEYKVDGWEDESMTVYEFHGCIYHGCPRCYNPDTFNPLKNELMKETYRKHLILES